MNKTERKKPIYNFGDFAFDSDTHELRKNGVRVSLKLQPARLLHILLQRAPDTVLRKAIYDALWNNGTVVEFDQNLNACILQLRTVLGDKAAEPEFIETLPKRGYRFIAPVQKRTHSHRKWTLLTAAVSAAVVIAVAVTLVLPENKPSGDPPRIYVSPIETVAMENDASAGLFQQGLRLAVINRLTRVASTDILTVNGETLWADEKLLRLDDETDYRMNIRIDSGANGYRAHARLTREGSLKPDYQQVFLFDVLDRHGVAGVSTQIAQWAASSLGSDISDTRAADIYDDPDYFDAIVRAKRARQLGDRASLEQSLEWGEKALAISPSSSEAKGVMAIALAVLAGRDEYPAEATYKRALRLADEVRSANGSTVESELTRGFIALYRDWDLAKAQNAFDLALELAPGNALVHAWRASVLGATGDAMGAAQAVDIAVRLDPLSMSVVSDRCWYLGAARRFEEAVAACNWALELQPKNYWSVIGLVASLEVLGRTDEAMTVLSRLMDRVGTTPNALPLPDDSLAESDHTPLQRLQCELATSQQQRAENYSFPFFELAALWAQCGDFKATADSLLTAKSGRESGVLFFNIDPRFDVFRNAPEAEAIDLSIKVRRAE